MSRSRGIALVLLATIALGAGQVWAQGEAPGGFASEIYADAFADAQTPPAPPARSVASRRVMVNTGANVRAAAMTAGCGCEPACDSGCASCCDDCNSCGESCGCDSCGGCGCGCAAAGPWTLFGPVLEGSAWSAGGWISGGVYDNGYGINNNGPLGFRNLAKELTLDQGWAWLERSMDSSEGFDYGFRVDYIFGVDGPDTQAFGDGGWDFGWDSSPRGGAGYGSAIPQLYGEAGYGDLSVKFGHFYTIMGYEVVQDTGNFFYSHAYTMYYGEPFTHTGFLLSYALSDNVSLVGGWTMGWDSGFENLNDASTFLGGVNFGVGEAISVAWTLSFGDNGRDPSTGDRLGDVFLNSLVITTQLTENTQHVLLSDMGRINDLGFNDTEWYSVVNYLMYSLTDTIAVGGRCEWFYDASGNRIDPDNGTDPVMGGIYRGAQGAYWDITLGANWKPMQNVVVRPEMRWDWFDPTQAMHANPYNNGTRNSQFTYGVSTLMTY
jgi:hypothetical protein